VSDTLETDAFIEGLNDDWDVEFAALTAFAKQLERERDQARMESAIFEKETRRLVETLAAKRAAEIKEEA
jgi:hypothetical protein